MYSFDKVYEIEGNAYISYEEARDMALELSDLREEFIHTVDNLVGGCGPEMIPEWVLDELEERY